MPVPKYYKKDLIAMGDQGYKFIHCETEKEVYETRDYLRSQKKCATIGFVINQLGETIYFVATKERNKKTSQNG